MALCSIDDKKKFVANYNKTDFDADNAHINQNRNRWLPNILIAIVAFFLVLSSHSELSAADKTILRPSQLKQYISGKETPPDNLQILLSMASVAPEGSSWYNFLVKNILPQLKKISNNTVEIKLYGGGVMGDEADTIRKLKMGQLQILGVTNMGLAMMIPELCVFSLPCLFDWEPDLFYAGKRTEVDYILEKFEPTISDLAEKRGYQFLGVLETCFESLGTPIPIQSIDDLGKIKFWLWRGDSVKPEVNKALNISAVPMELYDVSQALSTGVIDTTQVAWYVSVVLQWWPYIKYVTDYPFYGYESATVLADRKTFDNLTAFFNKWGHKYGIADGQTLVNKILELTDNSCTELRFVIRQDEAKARARLLQEGIKETHFPESELTKLKKIVEPLYGELAEKNIYPKELLREILLYREQYRELKAGGKLNDDWYVNGIMPDGDNRNEWRQ